MTTAAQETLDALKAECFRTCMEAEVIAAAEEDDERHVAALEQAAQIHASHAVELEAAYAAFAADAGPSNPAPEGETFIEADIVVDGEATPQ